MLKKSVEDALNKQLNAELYSSYLYLAMAAYMETLSMKGFAHWLRLQSKEELAHGMKFYDYLIEAGGTVKLAAIDAPKTSWKSAGAVFDQVYAQEQKVTGLINNLANLAAAQKDNATVIFMQWFVSEQVEEEKNAGEVVHKVKLAGENPGALLISTSCNQRH